MVPRANEIITRASWDLNLREVPIGSNNGGRLREVLKRTAFKPGEPWCMYWVSSVMLGIYKTEESLPNSVIVTGSCQQAAMHARAIGKLGKYPATGCIFLLQNTEHHFHHAGFVTSVDEKNGLFHTIEGNTNENGSTEGFGVFHHERKLGDHFRYITW